MIFYVLLDPYCWYDKKQIGYFCGEDNKCAPCYVSDYVCNVKDVRKLYCGKMQISTKYLVN